MVEEGESVTVQSGMFSGKQGEVRRVDAEAGIVTVIVEGFGAERETRVPIDDVEPTGGDREELMQRVEVRVREAVGQPYELRRNLWWAERASQGDEPSEELLEEFEEAREQISEEYETAVGRELEQVRDDLADAEADDIQRWLARAADTLDRTWRSRAEARQRQFLGDIASDEQVEQLREEAIEQGEDDDLLDDEALADRAVERLVSEMIDEGLELWNECEERRSLVEADGYRWETIAPGELDLEVLPPNEERPERDADEAAPESVAWTLPGEPEVWGRVLVSQLQRLSFEHVNVEALVTRSGKLEQFGANPWQIPGRAGVGEALETVWGPLEERMVHAYDALHRRCLAVAELETDAGRRLAYLVVGPAKTHELTRPREHWPQSAPYDEMAERLGDGFPACIVGAPPDDSVEIALGDGEERFSLPMSLRELRTRHESLRAPRMWLGESFATLGAVPSFDASLFREANDEAEPEQFVAFGADDNGNAQVFDRDELDRRHDPKVAGWNRQNGLVGQRHPFWPYFDAIFRGMMGIVPE